MQCNQEYLYNNQSYLNVKFRDLQMEQNYAANQGGGF
jgi:hypothetical protein